MKTNNTLLLKRTYAVPINLLWQVLTEKEHQKQWYFDFGEDWRLEIGAVFQWYAESPDCVNWLHKGVVLEVIENKKLSHSWEYPGYSGSSIVTWELHAIDANNTELSLTHLFTTPFDESVEALRRENFEQGWNQILSISLLAYTEKINLL